MQLPKIPNWQTTLQWSRANWIWIIAFIVLPTVLVVALKAWHSKRLQKTESKPEKDPDGSQMRT